jgi:hypothetical protein
MLAELTMVLLDLAIMAAVAALVMHAIDAWRTRR